MPSDSQLFVQLDSIHFRQVDIQQQTGVRFGHLRGEQMRRPFKVRALTSAERISLARERNNRESSSLREQYEALRFEYVLSLRFGDLLFSVRRVKLNKPSDGYTYCEIRLIRPRTGLRTL